jgi:hypothetical protein
MIKGTPSPAPALTPEPVFVPSDISTKSISSSTADLLMGWVVKKIKLGQDYAIIRISDNAYVAVIGTPADDGKSITGQTAIYERVNNDYYNWRFRPDTGEKTITLSDYEGNGTNIYSSVGSYPVSLSVQSAVEYKKQSAIQSIGFAFVFFCVLVCVIWRFFKCGRK